MQLSTVNVVASFDLGVTLDLHHIHASNLGFTRYNPIRFSGLTLKLARPRASVLLFSTGKAIILGASTVTNALFGARKAAKHLRSLGYTRCAVNGFSIKNVVVSARLPYAVNIRQLATNHQPEAIYEPELFAALVYKLSHPTGKAIIFEKGLINIVGIDNEQDAWAAAASLEAITSLYRKPSTLDSTNPMLASLD